MVGVARVAYYEIPDPDGWPRSDPNAFAANLRLESRYELEVERGRLAGTLDQIEPLATAQNGHPWLCLTRASRNGQQGSTPATIGTVPDGAKHQHNARFPTSQSRRPRSRSGRSSDGCDQRRVTSLAGAVPARHATGTDAVLGQECLDRDGVGLGVREAEHVAGAVEHDLGCLGDA